MKRMTVCAAAVTALLLGWTMLMAADNNGGKTATSAPAAGAKSTWTDSYTAAAAESKKSGKPIFAFFTGSDWCGWCKKLRSEVLDTPEFAAWAKNVVLLEVDFPHAKKLDDATKKQNDDLAKKYEIQGYPTIVFLNADGKKLGTMGYKEGGPKAWIEKAQNIVDAAKAK